ncbi:hypothetical protein DQ238_16900 [Geodermatophilus sp. TF02-6]|uniref:hypothetical protein n=1 Tax=Geodermatophilus sp. TF02-6 TaxID=2250575 RepID=UPI000DE852BE|nr:hypothetical protein [Geodermatophilus sp. TF02-6]RBY76744.1 hypothetical protein DQ238_16900 [Geodermatophilus sp. TF02-6]
MFEDQMVELLPERTTMQVVVAQNGNQAFAVAANVLNANIGGNQLNAAFAAALAGSNVIVG